MKVKKIKLEAMSNYHAGNNQHGADSENGDMNSSVGKFYMHWKLLRAFCYQITFFSRKIQTNKQKNYCLPIQEVGTFSSESSVYFEYTIFASLIMCHLSK